MGDTLDMLAHYRVSRVFVFDGIASTVEYALMHLDPEVEEADVDKHRPLLSKEASSALARLLIRFVLGFYQNDLSLSVPAMLCLEKIYRHSVDLTLEMEGMGPEDLVKIVPDKEFWQNIAVAIYSVCRSPDSELSTQGVGTFRRVIIPTSVGQIPDDKWADVLFLMVNKQPPVVADISRGNTFSILGELLARVLPTLSHNMDLRDDLVDLIEQVAQLAQDNLRQGRRGSVSPVFEKTVETVTSLSNQMKTEEWTGEAEFSNWASECLLGELERVGAAGAALQNQKAVQAKYSAPASPRKTAK